ncbi:MAG: hypothetical protein QUV05_20010 [Phycisphaerae bacterium]|nr:hypothetical protein [Phycisphaerae bacterium]
MKVFTHDGEGDLHGITDKLILKHCGVQRGLAGAALLDVAAKSFRLLGGHLIPGQQVDLLGSQTGHDENLTLVNDQAGDSSLQTGCSAGVRANELASPGQTKRGETTVLKQ